MQYYSPKGIRVDLNSHTVSKKQVAKLSNVLDLSEQQLCDLLRLASWRV